MNCSPELPWRTKAEHLSKFSYSLKTSGYSHKYRVELINGIISRYKEIQGQVARGKRCWYRTRKQINEQNVMNGGFSAATWFLGDGVTQTLVVGVSLRLSL